MKICVTHSLPRRQSDGGFTLIEVLIASGLAVVLLAVLGALSLYGSRSFAALTNYVDLDNKSRATMDLLSREIRQATAVIAVQTNLPVKSLTLMNADEGTTLTLTWDSAAGTLVSQKTGQPAQTHLTGCDVWNFNLYQRTPLVTATNILCYPAVNAAGVLDVSRCKIVDMSWKCSRTIMGRKVNTESIQTAQIVLRNKQ